ALGAVLFIGLKKDKQEDAGHASGLSSVEQQDAMKAVAPADEKVEQTFQSAQRQGGRTGKSAPQELSDAVKALIGEDGKEHNYSTLLAEINTLSYEIAPDDLTALMDMLNFSNDQFPEGMRPVEINAVKNDVLDKLLRQSELPEGLGLQMVEMAGNADNDPVWRDYCIQFCPTAWERIDAESRISNNEQGITK
ncbi:hypothetical protein P4C99_22130, partial [Pontiellaceae bacterium B1224]|nr:hypothetical protein [Pontiellaceae bacterium B1224]